MLRDYAGIARRYAEDVVAGKILAGRWVKAACARHLSDLDRAAKGWDFYFDAEDAAHLCGFTEQLCHIKGELAGRKLHLEPWEVFILAVVNGWRRVVDGGRRFRTCYIEVPRKNGKSTLIAPPLLFLMTADGENGPEVYTAATKMRQAKIVFNLARAMALRSPELRAAAGLLVQTHKIIGPDEAFFEALEAKKLDGLNPHGAGIDELHEHRDRVVFDALADAMGARHNPLMIAITTAGRNLEHICYEQHLYVAKILGGVLTDETYFGVMFALDPDDDPMDEATWSKANPNLGVSKRIDYMRQQAARAQASPAQMGEYLRKHCGIWTRAGVSAVDQEGWSKGRRPSLSRDDYSKAGGVVGVDLAIREDWCAVVYLHSDPDGGWTVFADHFATEDSLNQPGREQQRAWGQEGLIEVHAGASIDLDRIEQVVELRVEQFGAERAAVDPHLGAQMMMRLEGRGVPVVEVRQRYMVLSAPFDQFIANVKDGKVRHDGDPVLAWQVSNVIERQSGEFRMPGKRVRAEKIDAVSAIVTGAALLDPVEEVPTSPWDNPDFSLIKGAA